MGLSRPARWLFVLWLALLLLSRFKVAGMPVSVLVPLTGVWMLWGLYRGYFQFNLVRLPWFLLTMGTGALLMPLQVLLVPDSSLSLTAWALIAAVWCPFVLQVNDSDAVGYLPLLRAVGWSGVGLGVVAIAMIVTQFLGVQYQDWFANLVPATWRFQEDMYVITYPVEYGSEIYRSNAWIGLEPSFVSAQLGITLIASLLVRMRWWVIALQVLAIGSTYSGSGILLLVLALAVMIAHRYPLPWRGYLVAAAVGLVGVFASGAGAMMLGRLAEGSNSRSSTSLRTVTPYELVWPIFERSPIGMLVGRGPGASQDVVDAFGIPGLLAPTPLKLLFEYGFVGGGMLAVFMVVCVMKSPSRTLAFSQFIALWTIQAGSTSIFILIPLFVTVTAWNPRSGLCIERSTSRLSVQPKSTESLLSEPVTESVTARERMDHVATHQRADASPQ